MTITIFGASGVVGKYVVSHALSSGYTVIAFASNIDKLIDKDLNNKNFTAIKGYVFDENDVLNALKNTNAVVSVLGGAVDGSDKTRSLGIKNIISQMQISNLKRIVALGGIGVLNDNSNTLLMDSPDFPKQYLPVSYEHLQAYKYLESSPLDWTFVCPPKVIDRMADGRYFTSMDRQPADGKDEVAAGNVADFILKELKKEGYLRKRVGIADEFLLS